MTTYEVSLINGDDKYTYGTEAIEEGGRDEAINLIRGIIFDEIKELAQAYRQEELPDNIDLPEILSDLSKFAAQIPVIEDVITGPGTEYFGGLIRPFGQLTIVEIEDN